MKRTARNRRKSIVEDAPKPSAREKFMKGLEEIETMHQQVVPKFEAATSNQKLALSMLRAGKSVVFLVGSAGVGKSMIAAYYAACQMKQKQIEKIYLVRPAVACGKSIGLLPGDIKLKMEPYFAQTLAHLERFMGKGFLSYCLEKEAVEMKPIEYMRGMSFSNSVVILEEGQNLTAEEFEMMLTRLGDNATLIITADEKQRDLKNSGLTTTINMIDNIIEDSPEYMLEEDIDSLDDLTGVVRFTPDDVVRSGLTRAFVKMYYNN